MDLGGGSPVEVDFEPSIELADGYRNADISARARPQGRDASGFKIPSPLEGAPTSFQGFVRQSLHHAYGRAP